HSGNGSSNPVCTIAAQSPSMPVTISCTPSSPVHTRSRSPLSGSHVSNRETGVSFGIGSPPTRRTISSCQAPTGWTTSPSTSRRLTLSSVVMGAPISASTAWSREIGVVGALLLVVPLLPARPGRAHAAAATRPTADMPAVTIALPDNAMPFPDRWPVHVPGDALVPLVRQARAAIRLADLHHLLAVLFVVAVHRVPVHVGHTGPEAGRVVGLRA